MRARAWADGDPTLNIRGVCLGSRVLSLLQQRG